MVGSAASFGHCYTAWVSLLPLSTISKAQPSPYSITQAKPNARRLQIRPYEILDLTETPQVALFSAGDVSDMAVPCWAIFVDAFFDPNLHYK